MKPYQLALIGLALFVGFKGYQKNPNVLPSPTPNVVVPNAGEQFPSQPVNPQLVNNLEALAAVGITPEDALVMARAFRDWADLVGRDARITSLTAFDSARVGAIQHLLNNSPIQGKYTGKISPVMNNAYRTAMAAFLDEKGEVKSMQVTPQVRQALVDYLNALSWKFSVIAGVK